MNQNNTQIMPSWAAGEYEQRLEDYYRQDVWVLSECPRYALETEPARIKLGSSKMDFRRFSNPYLKQELKYFYQCKLLIDNIKLRTLAAKQYELSNFMAFMNDRHPEIGSIFQIERQQYRTEYGDYLVNTLGYRIYEQFLHVDSGMQWREYTCRSKRFVELFWLPEHLETFLYSDSPFSTKDDIWDIRRMPFHDKTPQYRPRYTLSFEKIIQPSIKDAAKHFIYHKLAVRELSTCQDYLKAINLLSEYLHLRHPDILCLAQINRSVIEEYFQFAREVGRFNERTLGYRIGKTREFLETCVLLDLPNKPGQKLILDSDYHTMIKSAPRFFTDEELRQFNQHAKDLPLMIARMLFVIESVGMRISELCTLQPGCVTVDADGNAILCYYQHKTKKANRIPISNELRITIENALRDSRESFGEDVKYVFARNHDRPISVETFHYHLNLLSKNKGFVDRAGRPLRIKSHRFRATVATNYMNIGLDSNVIRMMIGQADIRSLRYYAETSNDRVISAMVPIIAEQEKLIKSIGDPSMVREALSIETYRFQPLCNGDCMKEGTCEHFNACYTCSMFLPDRQHLAIYQFQLRRAEENISFAQTNGLARVQQINEDLRDNLLRIIERISEEGAK